MKSITKRADQLSPEAAKLYRRSNLADGTLQKVGSGNWWKPELQPAIDELVESGRARFDVSHFSGEDHYYLWTDVVSKHYTSAIGRSSGGFEMRIRILGSKARRYDDAGQTSILADFDGAYIERRDSSAGYSISAGPKWRIVVRHENATDFEHDSIYLAEMMLEDVSLADINYYAGETVLIGRIAENPHLYPMGIDPFFTTHSEDYRTPKDGELEMCDYENCQTKNPHPIGPYMPPEVEGLIGKKVSVVYRSKPVVERNEDDDADE